MTTDPEVTEHTEWAVIWPSGDDEIIDPESLDIVADSELYARDYARQFNPPPRVVSRTVRVTEERGEWRE
jgi:hypothetical protein